MSNKEFSALKELAEKESRRKRTPEEALQNLINAGILNKDKEFTPPYRNLERIVIRK